MEGTLRRGNDRPHRYPEDKELDDVIDKGVAYLQALGDDVSKRLEPQWNSRVGILKTIISLCSASVVLTVTFSTSFRSLAVGPFWKWLIIVSFGLLVTSLLLAFFALWVSAAVYELPAEVFTLKVRVPQAVKTSDTQQDFLKKFGVIKRDVFERFETVDLWGKRLFRASCISFCTAMLLLAAVGFRQLSF